MKLIKTFLLLICNVNVAVTGDTCINELPESLSLWEEDSIPNGTIAFVNDSFSCSGIITHVSVGYEAINDDYNNGMAVYLQLRRIDSNNLLNTVQLVSLPIGDPWNETDDRYFLNNHKLSDAIQFQENDYISIFTSSNSRVKVLVDANSNDSSGYINCPVNLSARECLRMSIPEKCDSLLRCFSKGALQLKITSVQSCPSLTDPNNGTINCSLGDDRVPSYEDTCSFTCNTGYELTGSETRTCQTDGSWSGNRTRCRRVDTCTKGFIAIGFDNIEEDDSIVSVAESFTIIQGHYLYPELNFQCRVKITRLHGLFIVTAPSIVSGYIQLWRDNINQSSREVVMEIPLDFKTGYSTCNRSRCILNYELPPDLQIVTEIGDFFGLFSLGDSPNRPVFYPIGQTELFGYQNLCNQQKLTINIASGFVPLLSLVAPLIYFDFDEADATPSPALTRGPICFSTNSENITVIVVAAVSCAILAMVVIMLLLTVYCKRKLKPRHTVLTSGELSATYHRIVDPYLVNHSYQQIQSDSHPGHVKRRDFKSRMTSSALTGSYVTISDVFDPYEVPFKAPCTDLDKISAQLSKVKVSPTSVELGTEIGSGKFGTVFHGVWNHDDQVEQVAVKMLHDVATEKDKIKLLKEAAIIEQFAHNNIVKLCGVVSQDPMMILLEYLSNGNLLSYLISIRPKEGEPVGQHIPQMLLGFARDVVRGMNYLSNKRFIHRDLAARNILLTEDNYCKIADFGMSRDLEDDKYYVTQGGFVPLRWTAPEALMYKTYTTASDVWSYGVLLYEMWSLGHKPYEDNDNSEVLDKLETGYRLPPPPGCPRHIYCVMIQCWNPQHKLRPSFSNLLRVISQPPYVLFHWFEEDKQTAGPECDVIGAPIKAGHNLYPDLQNMYKL